MTTNLSNALAQSIADDRLRTAQKRRTTRPAAGRLRRLMRRR